MQDPCIESQVGIGEFFHPSICWFSYKGKPQLLYISRGWEPMFHEKPRFHVLDPNTFKIKEFSIDTQNYDLTGAEQVRMIVQPDNRIHLSFTGMGKYICYVLITLNA